MQPHHAVHLRGEALIVGRDQGRAALAADQVQEFGEDGVRGILVEIAGRLVGEDQRRLVSQRAGDRDALLLAARQFRRAMIEPVARPSAPSNWSRALARSCRLRPLTSWGSTTFSTALNSTQQVMKLVDEAEQFAAQARAPVVVEFAPLPRPEAGSSP